MEKCGHFPHIENPQKFNRILHDFLTDANSRPLEITQSQRWWWSLNCNIQDNHGKYFNYLRPQANFVSMVTFFSTDTKKSVQWCIDPTSFGVQEIGSHEFFTKDVQNWRFPQQLSFWKMICSYSHNPQLQCSAAMMYQYYYYNIIPNNFGGRSRDIHIQECLWVGTLKRVVFDEFQISKTKEVDKDIR